MKFENVQTIKAHDPDSRYGPPAEDEVEEVAHPLDSEKSVLIHQKCMEWYTQEREIQAYNRLEMATDEDFYDSLQYSDEDAQTLRDRGQAPLVYNLVKPTIDWIIGTERRTRVDGMVLPREENDVKGAETKTKVMKYVSDVNKSAYAWSRAFADTVKAGVGWIEGGIQGNPDEELLYCRHENWRNMFYDSRSTEPCLKDARYIFRQKYVDLDIAEAYYPERKEQLRRAAVSADYLGSEEDEDFWYLGQHFQARDRQGNYVTGRSYTADALFINRRARVKLIECWYREPTVEIVCRGEIFDGDIYDPSNSNMKTAVEQQAVSLHNRVSMTVHVAIMTEQDIVYCGKSPYRHNRFPFTPIWAYRRKRDNAPYGAIRPIRDPQEDLNKRASKALFILSSNRIIMDDGAVDDEDHLREEAARPDGILKKKKGYELKTEANIRMAEEHMQLMDRDAKMIQNTGGVTDENLGRETNAKSGIAIQARQDQGATVNIELFDNKRFAMLIHGEKELSTIEQYYTDRKVVRIVGSRKKLEWTTVNEYDPETGEYNNDLTANQADYVISEQDYRASVRQAMFDTLAEMVGKLDPQIAMNLMDIVFELSDLPEKEELVKRMRQLNGQRDETEELTPEEIAALEEEQKAMAEQQAAEKEMFKKQLDTMQAQIDKLKAEAGKTRVEAQSKAVETSMNLSAMPAAGAAADTLLSGAGLTDHTGAQP